MIQDWVLFVAVGVLITIDIVYMVIVTAIPESRLQLENVEMPSNVGCHTHTHTHTHMHAYNIIPLSTHAHLSVMHTHTYTKQSTCTHISLSHNIIIMLILCAYDLQ